MDFDKVSIFFEDLKKYGSEVLLTKKSAILDVIMPILEAIEKGQIRAVLNYNQGQDLAKCNIAVKQAILLYMAINSSIFSEENHSYDKIPLRFRTAEECQAAQIRTVSGSIVRRFSYIGNRVILMPSFVNIGAYVDDSTMIDTWVTVGSCAQIGKNCHLSGGVGIGGVLEPLDANPVIIEDDVFIGARSEVVNGVRIGRGSVLSMGVYLGPSTKIIYRNTKEIIYGYVPEYSVVVPGNYDGLYCAVIIKTVDEKTRKQVEINNLLRD